MQYWVKPYDGEGGQSLATLETVYGPFDMIEVAREFIKRKLGGHDYGQWDGDDDDVECWHESEDVGCGGYAISLDWR